MTNIRAACSNKFIDKEAIKDKIPMYTHYKMMFDMGISTFNVVSGLE